MIRASVVAILLAVLLALAFPAAADLDPGRCETKRAVIAEVYRQIPAAFVTDLAGPIEGFFLGNLSRVTGYDYRGADVVLVRRPGGGRTLIIIFRAGCMDTSTTQDNLIIQPLLAMPIETEI